MKIACLLTPLNRKNLTLASQIGVEEIVCSFPGADLSALRELRDEVGAYGMRLTTVERFVPHHQIVHGLPGHEAQTEAIQRLIQNMGELGLTTLCYNWMPSEDWNRTRIDLPERGGALVTEFNIAEKPQVFHGASEGNAAVVTPPEKLWETLAAFQEQLVPVAEEAGINLAIHPDDLPLAQLGGQAQLLGSPEALERAVSLVPSERNGLCFCQGTMASRGDLDIPATIARLGKHIRMVHFRDVVGDQNHFRETFHDNGQTDMAAAWRAYEAVGLENVPIRPDHVPTMFGDTNEHAGYEMQGRLFAVGYMKGLRDACR